MERLKIYPNSRHFDLLTGHRPLVKEQVILDYDLKIK
jgi:hypothetical protein